MIKVVAKFGLILGVMGLGGCLPAVMESELAKAPKLSELDGRFNRVASLHRYGDAPTDWIADERHHIYAGVTTPVRLNVSERALVTLSAGTIRRDSVQKDLFYIDCELSGISVTLSAKEFRKTGESEQTWRFSAVPLPTPVLRLPIQVIGGQVAAADMRGLRGFDLLSSVVGQQPMDFMCPCKSFELQRINVAGQRETVVSKNGDMNADIVVILGKAEKGDIYIFKQIKTACTPKEKTRTLPSYAFEMQ